MHYVMILTYPCPSSNPHTSVSSWLRQVCHVYSGRTPQFWPVRLLWESPVIRRHRGLHVDSCLPIDDLKSFFPLPESGWGSEETPRGLRALVSLLEDLSPTPSILMVVHPSIVPVPGNPTPLLTSSSTGTHSMHRQTCRLDTCVYKIKNKSF